jgi:hypothetical protein
VRHLLLPLEVHHVLVHINILSTCVCPNDRTDLWKPDRSQDANHVMERLAQASAANWRTAIELRFAEDEVAESLARHTAFVHAQDALGGVDNIISAWQEIASISVLSHETDIRRMSRLWWQSFESIDLSEDMLERFDQIHHAAQADWDRLVHRYIVAVKSVL